MPAQSLLSGLREVILDPDLVSYTAGINGCENGDPWLQALALLSGMRETKVEPDVISYSAGTSAYKKGEQWQ